MIYKKIKTAIILGAGDGGRIGANMSKCLFDINRKMVIERLYEILDPYVDTIILVVGYKANEVKIKTARLQKIIYVENPEYATTETYYSLWLAREYLKDGFYLIDGDMVFEKEVFKSVAKYDYDCVVVDYSTKPKPDIGVICTDQRICVIGKGIKHPNAESLNIFKFSGYTARKIFRNEYINRKEAFYEEAFDMFNMIIHPIEVCGKWIEIDTIEDLQRAREIFK